MTGLFIEEHTQKLEELVRESGYAVAVLRTAGSIGMDYSRAMTVYETARKTLLAWCEQNRAVDRAESFIKRTYGPKSVAV